MMQNNDRYRIAGIRYFNAYGPRETHKGRMASVAFHNDNQFSADGRVKLFEGWEGNTVLAALATLLASGAGLQVAVDYANRAGGIVVGKLGTSVATREELS